VLGVGREVSRQDYCYAAFHATSPKVASYNPSSCVLAFPGSELVEWKHGTVEQGIAKMQSSAKGMSRNL
jgi:hypothetical protein